MVTIGQLTGMLLAVIIPVMTGIILFLHMNRELNVKGLLLTAGYGVAGYIWEAWIYVMAYGWVGAVIMQYRFFDDGFGSVLKQLIIAVVYALLTALGLVWAVYLSNMRERRMERGIPVGVGFGMAYSVWNYVLVYGAPLVIGFQMKFGVFGGSEETREKVLGLSTRNMYLFTLDNIIFILILLGTTLLMSKVHAEGRRGLMFMIPFISQFLIKFLNTWLPSVMPEVISVVLYHLLTGSAALWSLWIWLDFLKKKKVDLTPWKKEGSGT
ncbi:MAG: hypothetical protein J6P16_03620 [Eubacterium sp.]|nr:hypothetical protein [Eubacterium sp.]